MSEYKYFDKEVVVWFGNLGSPKNAKEVDGFNVSNFDHKVVIVVEIAAAEIRQMLQYDGWDKYYVCPNNETADRLLGLVSAPRDNETAKTDQILSAYRI